MNEPASLSAVEVLVLTRLLPVGEKGETKAKIQNDLEPLLGHRCSGSVLTEVLDRTLIKLVSRGLIARRPVKSKKAVPPVELTTQGRQTILDYLKVEAVPMKPKPTWSNLKHSLLMAPALDLPGPGEPLFKADGFRAVSSETGWLVAGDYPTLAAGQDGMAAADARHGDERESHARDRAGGLAEEGAGRRSPHRLEESRRSTAGQESLPRPSG